MWQNLLMVAVSNLPFLIGHVVAIIVGVVQLKRHPQPAVLTLLAGVLGLLCRVGAAVSQAYIQLRLADDPNATHTSAMAFNTAIRFVMLVLDAASTVLLVWAVFTGRRPVVPNQANDLTPPASRPRS